MSDISAVAVKLLGTAAASVVLGWVVAALQVVPRLDAIEKTLTRIEMRQDAAAQAVAKGGKQ